MGGEEDMSQQDLIKLNVVEVQRHYSEGACDNRPLWYSDK